MPAIERKGVSFTAALQEAAASALSTRAMVYAYELWHPTLPEPLRFVDDKAPLEATLEDDAPRNASEVVEFLACPLNLARPEESDTAASPVVTLSRPNISAGLKAALDLARGSIEPWTLIERFYASDDTSTPAILPPATYELTNADMAGPNAQINGGYDDDMNVAIPRITFRRGEYPGLKR